MVFAYLVFDVSIVSGRVGEAGYSACCLLCIVYRHCGKENGFTFRK